MKMNHLEIEFKTMLTKEENDRLLQLFADITPVSQTNYCRVRPAEYPSRPHGFSSTNF